MSLMKYQVTPILINHMRMSILAIYSTSSEGNHDNFFILTLQGAMI
jgi:hypothetical protein